MVKTTEELIAIRDSIYEKLYKEATPSADYWELVEEEDKYDTDIYKLYYLDDERQVEIIEEKCREHNLSKYNTEKIKRNVLLGAAPSGNKEKVKEARKEEGLRS